MIGSIRGILSAKKPPILLVEVSGIGYEISSPLSTFYHLPDVGKEVYLYTHLSVREDAHVLYGFYNEHERALFRSLIKVSNVGPKLALGILSGIEPDAFVRCIMEHDVQGLVRLPGVGKKTAERLVIEMRDRLHDWVGEHHAPLTSPESTLLLDNRIIQDAISALITLGYKPQEASRAVSQVKDTYTSREELIRLALQGTYKN